MAKRKRDPRLEGKVVVYKRSDSKQKLLVAATHVDFVENQRAIEVLVFSPSNGARIGRMNAMNLVVPVPPPATKGV